MANDWYRNTTWNDEVAENFFIKLGRARSQRDQYLVIQASTLSRVEPKVTLELTKLYFETKKSDFENVRALWANVNAFKALGRIDDVSKTYRAILKREREFPKHKTTSNVDYPYWVATKELSNEYQDALDILKNDKPLVAFPIDRFKRYSALAIINNDPSHARKALDVAQVKKSGFRYHQNIGLVGKEHNETIKKLIKIKI